MKKFALNSQLQPFQILTNDVQMLILCLSYFITTVKGGQLCRHFIGVFLVKISLKSTFMGLHIFFQCLDVKFNVFAVLYFADSTKCAILVFSSDLFKTRKLLSSKEKDWWKYFGFWSLLLLLFDVRGLVTNVLQLFWWRPNDLNSVF